MRTVGWSTLCADCVVGVCLFKNSDDRYIRSMTPSLVVPPVPYSRLSGSKLAFNPYNFDQLKEILNHRLQVGAEQDGTGG